MKSLAHAHTCWSHDSSLSFDQWRAIAERQGCDAVLLSEHEESGWTKERYAEYVRTCVAESTDKVTFVPGIEFNQEGFHILCYGLKEFPLRPGSIRQLAAAVHEQGCFLCLAHPAKYRWRYPAHVLEGVDAVEVWNSKWIYDGSLGPHPRTLALAKKKMILPGQDVHKVKHLSTLFFVTETTSILEDLKSGRYVFAMEGQKIDVQRVRQLTWRGPAQQVRTPVLRLALAMFRQLRRAGRAAGMKGWRKTVLPDNISVR